MVAAITFGNDKIAKQLASYGVAGLFVSQSHNIYPLSVFQ